MACDNALLQSAEQHASPFASDATCLLRSSASFFINATHCCASKVCVEPACVMQAGKVGTHILWPRPNRGSSKRTGSCWATGEAAGFGIEGCIPANRCSSMQYPGQHAQPAGPQAASELPAVRHLYQAAASSCSSAQVSLVQHSIMSCSSHHHDLLLARCCYKRFVYSLLDVLV